MRAKRRDVGRDLDAWLDVLDDETRHTSDVSCALPAWQAERARFGQSVSAPAVTAHPWMQGHGNR